MRFECDKPLRDGRCTAVLLFGVQGTESFSGFAISASGVLNLSRGVEGGEAALKGEPFSLLTDLFLSLLSLPLALFLGAFGTTKVVSTVTTSISSASSWFESRCFFGPLRLLVFLLVCSGAVLRKSLATSAPDWAMTRHGRIALNLSNFVSESKENRSLKHVPKCVAIRATRDTRSRDEICHSELVTDTNTHSCSAHSLSLIVSLF